MTRIPCFFFALAFLSEARAQDLKRNIPYADPAHERQVLDVYAPPQAKNLPVVFWIHGGGWQTGDKSSVQHKPQVFMDKGFVFVSTNYRLLPSVDMGTIIHDIARSIHWVHDHIAEHGGDPNRLLVMGHSAGAQLAAIVCTDDRYLKAEGLSLAIVKGWRGEICHVALTDAQGQFSRYKIVDPSFHNWTGLALALRDQQISDFPLCNKSFNLSYCGHDL